MNDAILPIWKPGFWRPKQLKIEAKSVWKVTWKQARKTIRNVEPQYLKTLRMGSKNQPKINDNFVPDLLVFILLLLWSSKVLQGVRMAPHGAKINAPRPSNGNREEIKGAGGRGRSSWGILIDSSFVNCRFPKIKKSPFLYVLIGLVTYSSPICL